MKVMEEMKEQTKNFLSTISLKERDVVLDIGGEGGGICIFKKRIKNKYVFIYQHNEDYFGDESLSVNKAFRFDSFELAFQRMNSLYQLHFLYLLTVDIKYSNYVADELVKKLNLDRISLDEFHNRFRFEEILNIKLEFDTTENKWEKRVEGIDQLIYEASEFDIENIAQSYLKSYPYFINYFGNIQNDKIEIDNLIIGIHFVYGWMPTIFELKNTNEKELFVATEILNKAKIGHLLTRNDYVTLKGLLNGSLVGTSKLLHFINPEKYAIWDSRVHNYMRKNIKSIRFSYDIGDISNYMSYLNYLTEVSNSDLFPKIYNPVNGKILSKFNYSISSFRVIELLMFINRKKL